MRHALLFVAVSALSAGVFSLSPQETPSTPQIPGITGTDPFPKGCVNCHAMAPDGKDMRLSTMLKGVKGHPDITESVKVVPMDCMACHPHGTKMGLDRVLHPAHYAKQEKSLFVTKFGGNCTNCHSISVKTGKIGIKSGMKNW